MFTCCTDKHMLAYIAFALWYLNLVLLKQWKAIIIIYTELETIQTCDAMYSESILQLVLKLKRQQKEIKRN